MAAVGNLFDQLRAIVLGAHTGKFRADLAAFAAGAMTLDAGGAGE